ncbi:MAG: SAM-dependent methyltransferase, partial [Gammaproteobacteria bacterium]|nr:SAM-dependent methyltransferase [Gammaproteobacteria bacterium]
ITAPELSDVFARGIAHQCAEVLRQVGGGIVEFGAGSGKLARDVLRCLDELGQLPTCYTIIEPSPALRAQQQQLLTDSTPQLRDLITWSLELSAQPMDGVILGNEVIDAFPVKRFVASERGVNELFVGSHGAELIEFEEAPTAALRDAVTNLFNLLDEDLPRPYQSEINLRQGPWLHTLGQLLRRGMVLLVDYGYARHEYYHPQRDHGTLICHYRHHAHDQALLWPGLQDLSAFVDFTSLAEAAEGTQLTLTGYATQAGFLLSTLAGQEHAGLAPRHRLHLANALKTLTLPGVMGEKFKVIAFSRDCDVPLHCLPRLDQRHRLLPPRRPIA